MAPPKGLTSGNEANTEAIINAQVGAGKQGGQGTEVEAAEEDYAEADRFAHGDD